MNVIHDCGQTLRFVRISDVELADLAITIANIPAVKEIIACAVVLDRRNRPEKYAP